MSIASTQADAFFTEVFANGRIWAIRDKQGFPTSTTAEGATVMPFWSLASRAQTVIEKVAAYRDFTPHELSLEEFRGRWLPGLEKDGLLVGLNWSGDRATGYDLKPGEVEARLATLPRNP